jgi:hypothetical protein
MNSVQPGSKSDADAATLQDAPVITLALNGIYFDQIKVGTKTEEYRLVTPYWSKRLVGRRYGQIVLTRGYPPAGDHERRLTLPWRGYTVKTITHPHFGSEPVEVFAIDVGAPSASTTDDSRAPGMNPNTTEPTDDA